MDGSFLNSVGNLYSVARSQDVMGRLFATGCDLIYNGQPAADPLASSPT